jgi:hypothetical protein
MNEKLKNCKLNEEILYIKMENETALSKQYKMKYDKYKDK